MNITLENPFFAWLIDMLKAIAEIRVPFLDSVMLFVSDLGLETFFIVLGLAIVWCVDKKFGYRFFIIFLVGNYLNMALKAVFRIPRPWVIDKDFKIVEAAREGATGWSFPSGHTQSATLLYGSMPRLIKKTWSYIVAGVIILSVAFSRMYLGVHTLLDVGAAIIVSVAVIILVELLFKRIGDGDRAYAIVSGVATAVLLARLVYLLVSGDADASQLKDAAVIFGTSAGLFAGSLVERYRIKFDTKAVWWMQIIKVVLGVGLILAIRVGLKPLLALISPSPVMDAVRYFAMCFFALGVYPLVFKLFAKVGKKK
ncbi:MAG: phosphatase PAP2 family protein [Clostridia bacterium]|nr:phosphatase PAP2 family protein [Clostridia bacterium]